MKITWSDCFRVIISIFLIYLGIFYWPKIVDLGILVFKSSLPIIIGLIIAYVLNILMKLYEKLFKKLKLKLNPKINRALSLIISLLTLGGIVTLLINIIIPELLSCISLLISEIPPLINSIITSENISNFLPNEILSYISDINWQDMITSVTQHVTSGLGEAVDKVMSTIGKISSAILTIFISIIFAIYFVLEKDNLKRQFKKFLHVYTPISNWEDKLFHVLRVMNDCFHKYIVGQCTEAVILGVLCILGMMFFKLPYPVMIGTLVGFLALIPIVGAWIAAIIGSIMIFTVSPVEAVFFLIFILVLQQLEGNLIYPKVVGNSIGLPAVWVLFAITVGGGVFGILGILFGVPITSTIYKLVKEDVNKREGV